VQVQQLHHDAGQTLGSDISSAAAAELHSINQQNNIMTKY